LITNILAFIFVLGILIFVHELGHFILARICGVGVEKFSLGFGPRLIGKIVGNTEYRISIIPLGGYVKMVGENPETGAIENPEISFSHKSVYRRLAIVSAGPIFNVLLTIFLLAAVFFVNGTYTLKPTIGKIFSDSPAMEAGLLPNDEITCVNDVMISTWSDFAGAISKSDGKPLGITIKRGEAETKLSIMPKKEFVKNIFGERESRFVIGVQPSGDVEHHSLNPYQATKNGVIYTGELIRITFLSVVKIIRGSVSSDSLGGPILIAQLAGDHAGKGMSALLIFTALLSINLAILNLLPIPVLDGGHIFFLLIELIIRKPVNLKVRVIAQWIGIALLTLLMGYVFYNDLVRIFTP